MTGRAPAPSDRSGRLDIARLCFAILVILAHSSEYIDGDRSREPLTMLFHTLSSGEVAVTGFFVLSGYLITRSWTSSESAIAYLRKRIARLYPAFVVASLLAILVVGRLAAVRPESYYRDIDVGEVLERLLTMKPPVGPPMFSGAPYPFLSTAMWTLQYELLCYVLVAVFGGLGLLRHLTIMGFAWAGLLIAVVVQRVATNGLDGPAILYGPLADPLRCFFLFLTGMLFAMTDLPRRGSAVAAAVAILALLLGLNIRILAEPVLVVAGGYLLLRYGLAPKRKSYRLPDLSYGTYLYGAPIEMLIIHFFPGIAPLTVFACTVPIALLMGWASWHWIERPALARWASRRSRPALAYC